MTVTAPRSTGLGRGVGYGLGAALVGAIAWAALTALTDYKLGLVAVAIGFLVGFAMQRSGSTDTRLPIAGAVVALLGCFVGDVLNDANGLATALREVSGEQVSMFTVLRKMLEDPRFFGDVFKAGFRGMDLLFYAIAAYEGFKFARIGVERSKAAATPPPAYAPPAYAPPVEGSAETWVAPNAEAAAVPGAPIADDSGPEKA